MAKHTFALSCSSDGRLTYLLWRSPLDIPKLAIPQVADANVLHITSSALMSAELAVALAHGCLAVALAFEGFNVLISSAMGG